CLAVIIKVMLFEPIGLERRFNFHYDIKEINLDRSLPLLPEVNKYKASFPFSNAYFFQSRGSACLSIFFRKRRGQTFDDTTQEQLSPYLLEDGMFMYELLGMFLPSNII
ncbi:hypothetical protein ACJX0J_024821, partial [Zea mays]